MFLDQHDGDHPRSCVRCSAMRVLIDPRMHNKSYCSHLWCDRVSNYVLATNNGPELGDFQINRGGYASIRAGGAALRRTKDRPIDGGKMSISRCQSIGSGPVFSSLCGSHPLETDSSRHSSGSMPKQAWDKRHGRCWSRQR